MNSHQLNFAKSEVNHLFDEKLFSTEAWIPKQDILELETLLKDVNIHVERIAVGKEEKVPTCMRNKGMHDVGEDLVKIYDIPDTQDKGSIRIL